MDHETRAQIVEKLWPYALQGRREAIEALMTAARLDESEKLTADFKKVLAKLRAQSEEIAAAAGVSTP